MTASVAPPPRRTRWAGGTVALACAAATALVVLPASPAHGDVTGSYAVVQNTASGALVTFAPGAAHPLAEHVTALAPDGSVDVLSAQVTPTHRESVVLDTASGSARIVALPAGARMYSGDGALVEQVGKDLALLDPTSGTTTPLAPVPAATDGTSRQLTAVAAVAGGAVVGTADLDGNDLVTSAQLWQLTSSTATSLTTLNDGWIASAAAGAQGIDALTFPLTGDTLTTIHVPASGSPVRTTLGLTLPHDAITADLGYTSSFEPLVTVTGGSATTVFDTAGNVLQTFPAGTRVGTSATDVAEPTSVVNPLAKTVALSGVPTKRVLAYGTAVTAAAIATATGPDGPGPAPAAVTLTAGPATSSVAAGRSVALRRNSCFTAASPATAYTQVAKPVTKCVTVANKLVLTSFSKKRVAILATTAPLVQLEVRRHGTWFTFAKVAVGASRVVRVAVPVGAVRALVPATVSNAATTLLVVKR